MDGVKRARRNWTEKGRKREGKNGGKIFVSRALVYSPLSLIANNFGFPDQPATSKFGNGRNSHPLDGARKSDRVVHRE